MPPLDTLTDYAARFFNCKVKAMKKPVHYRFSLLSSSLTRLLSYPVLSLFSSLV